MFNINKLNLKGGIVTYDTYNIKPEMPFQEQEWEFNEDILQIHYFGEYIIDLGWYPSHNPKGGFSLSVIKNNDWEKPILVKKFKEIPLVEQNIQQCIDFISSLKQQEQDLSKKA